MTDMSDINDKLVQQKTSATTLPWWQKRLFKITFALLGLIIILMVMTINVAKYETHLATGDTVLLALAPVDPRSFMQGDYMALSYALENDVFAALNQESSSSANNEEGYVIVARDENNVGQFVRLANTKPDNLAANEMAIYYRIRHNVMKLATNAFFFQEGHADVFEAAEYGLFRVNDKGAPLLTAMVDSKFKVINAEHTKVKEIQINKDDSSN